MKSISLRDYLHAALTARMLGAFLVLAIGAVGCVKLGSWQLARSLERGEAGARVAQQEMLAAPVRSLTEVLAPQTEFRAQHLGAKVSAKGSYRRQILIPNRQVAGQPATLIVTEFVIADGPAAGAQLPVLRGWVAPELAGVRHGVAYGLDRPELVVAPGEREIVGYLANSEQEANVSRIPNTLMQLSSAQLVNLWGGPIYTGYLVTQSTDPGLKLAPPPDLVKDSGRNWQNLGYAFEWFLFGGFALALWAKMVRDEAHR